MTGKTYTFEEVQRAMNDGIELVMHDPSIYIPDRYIDMLNLVGNAIISRLETPDIDLDDVIRENYSEEPEVVRGWIS